MFSTNRTWSDGLKAVLTLAVVAGLTACDGELLDVEDPDVVEPQEELTPDAVPSRFAGMLGDFREVMDNYVRYTSLFTDEMVLAGTFPTRIEVDERRTIPNNGSVNGEVWEDMQVARAQADVLVRDFEESLEDPEFQDIRSQVERGIAFGKLLQGYTRIFFAELFCQSIFGGDPNITNFGDLPAESAPLGSLARMQEALGILQEAESFASSVGQSRVANAARVGQARAWAFIGSLTGDQSMFANAAAAASGVPTGFTFLIEYSDNVIPEENEVFQITWAVNSSLRWTIGDGTDATRGNERFEFYSEWLDQGLIIPPSIAETDANKESFNGQTPVNLQTLYGDRSGATGRTAPIVLASGWEARMYEAENELRQGNRQEAEDIANALLEDEDQSNNPMLAVTPTLNLEAGPGAFVDEKLEDFEPVDFTGDILGSTPTLEESLVQMGRAYEAGMWLTGHRNHYLRRIAEEFDDRLALGMWPDKSAENHISLPVTSQEVDNNPNLSQSCPAGLP